MINNYPILSASNNNANNFIQYLFSHLYSIEESKNTYITGNININLIIKPTETPTERSNRLNYLGILCSLALFPGHLLDIWE